MSVFDDAVFYWLPGDAVTASSDTVSGTSASGTLTEGTAVTVSSRPGRTYSGATGSRFALNPVSGAHPKSMTVMVVGRIPTGTSGSFISYLDGAGPDTYVGLQPASGTSLVLNYRDRGAVRGVTGWPAVVAAVSANQNFRILIGTVSAAGSTVSVNMYLDGVSLGTDSEGGNASWTPSRVTVGRLDDVSPNNSSGCQVFRAYIWDRVLTAPEIAEATADPFDEAAVPSAPTNPAAVALSSSSIRVTWDNVADETGYRVERSPNGTTGWTNVSGSLAADTVLYDDTGLTASTQYFYRVSAFNATGDSPASTVVNATTSVASGNRMGGTGAIRKPPR